jgi:hypothetical protein
MVNCHCLLNLRKKISKWAKNTETGRFSDWPPRQASLPAQGRAFWMAVLKVLFDRRQFGWHLATDPQGTGIPPGFLAADQISLLL